MRPFDPAAWTDNPLAEPSGPASDPMGGPSGSDDAPDPRQLIVDMTASADATLTVGDKEVPLRPAYEGGTSQSPDGAVRVELLTPDKTWVHTVVRDAATGQPTPAPSTFAPRTDAISRPMDTATRSMSIGSRTTGTISRSAIRNTPTWTARSKASYPSETCTSS